MLKLMDNQGQSPSNPPVPDIQPTDPDQQPGHRKILQPSQSFVDEIKATPSQAPVQATPIQQVDLNQTTQTPPTPTVPIESNQQPAAKLDRASIYPTADHIQPLSAEDKSKKEAEESASLLTFPNGYSTGGTIFWYQFLAGIVVGIIFYILTIIISHTKSSIAITALSLIDYGIDLLVVTYVSYSVLKSKNLLSPFWLAISGIAALLTVSSAMVSLFVYVFLRLVLNRSYASFIAPSSLTSGLIIFLGIGVAGIIFSYYMSKLIYGLVFMIYGKIKSQAVIKIVGICIIAIFIGVLAFRVISNHTTKTIDQSINHSGVAITEKTPKNDPVPTQYVSQTITEHDFKVSLSFDPNANSNVLYQPSVVTDGKTIPASNDVVLTGNELSTTDKMTVEIEEMNSGADLNNLNQTQCPATNSNLQGSILIFDSTTMGGQTAFCSFDTQDTATTAYINTNSSWYMVRFETTVGLSLSYTKSMQTVASSIIIKKS